MKARPLFFRLLLPILLISGSPLKATTFTWDNSGGAPLNDGTGSWNATGGTNWYNNTALTYGAWGNTFGDTAEFGSANGAAGTVTVGSVNVGAIIFNAAGSGNYTLSSGTITLGGAAPTITTNADATISSTLAGTAGLIKSGGGKLTLSGNNSSGLSGGVTISSGILQLDSASAGGSISNTITLGDANTGTNATRLTINNSTVANPIVVSNQGSGTATIAYSVASGSYNNTSLGSIAVNRAATFTAPGLTNYMIIYSVFSGSGTLTFGSTNNQRLILQGAGSSLFTGDIVVDSNAVLEPRNMLTTTNGNNVTVNSSGELRIQNEATSINALNGTAGTVQSVNAAGSLTIGKGGGSGSYSGTMRNNPTVLSLTKSGTGTQTLSGANITFTGATALDQGTLALSQTTGWNSNVTLHNSNAATLQLNAPNAGDTWTYSKQILGGTSNANAFIEKTGNGSVVLNPAASSTFGGTAADAVKVTAGTLYVNAALNGAPPKVTVYGGIIGGKSTLGDTLIKNTGGIEGGQAGTGVLTVGNLTFGATSTDTASIRGTVGGTTPIAAANLTFFGGNGSVTLNTAGTSLTSGTNYILLSYSGTLGTPNVTNAVDLFQSTSRAFTPNVDTANKTIEVYYDANATTYWVGDAGSTGNEWSTRTLSPKNWKLAGNDSATDFITGDIMAFDNRGTRLDLDISQANISFATATFNNDTSHNYTIQSSGGYGITGGSIVKNGVGSLTLLTNNSLSGVTLNQGTLSFSNGGLGSSTATVGGNATLQWHDTNTQSVPVTINAGITATLDTQGNAVALTSIGGTGGLIKTGTGTLTLGGTSTLTGTTVSQGTLQLISAAAAGSGAITLGDANTGANNVQFAFGNSAADSGFTGNITVASAGIGTATIKLSDIGTGFSGTGTITLNRATTLDGTAISNGYYQSTRTFAGTGTLTYTGAADKRFILSNSSSAFTGDVVVQSGIFEPRNTLNTTTGSNMTVVSGAELRTDGNLTVNALNGAGTVQAVNFSPSTLTVGQNGGIGSFTGTLRGNGQTLSLTKSGTGTQALSGTGISYSGTTIVNAGTLQLTDATSFASSGVTLNGGTLELNRTTATQTFAQAIAAGTGAGNLVKSGNGSLILTGNNTYTGTTAVNGGTLVINGNQSTATGTVTVSNTGTRLMGSGTIGGNTTINSGAIHAPGNSPGVQNFSNNLTYASGSIFEWDLANSANAGTTDTRGTDYDGVNVSGTLAGDDAIFRVVLNAGSFTDTFWDSSRSWSDVFTSNNGSNSKDCQSIFDTVLWYEGGTEMTSATTTRGSFTISGSSLNWTAVPEPSGALAGLLAGAGLLRRRRNS